MKTYSNLPVPSPELGISHYLQEIRKFPVLEPEEEYILAKRWRNDADTTAAQTLVTSHLRLAAKIAMGYRGYGLPIEDVISEANVGLMQAVKRFDPEKGFRLATYALWWIKASVTEYIMRSSSLVKLGTTGAQKKLFFNLRKIKSKLGIETSGDMMPDDVKKIAETLNVTEEEVISMNRRMSAPDASLNLPARQDEDNSSELQDLIADSAIGPEEEVAEKNEAAVRHEMLFDALVVLNDREKDIFLERRLQESSTTLEKLAEKYGVSRERIRQIENRAFEKVQQEILRQAAKRGLIPENRA
ncbi:MAG: RNA polymerase sigma factor RpoH [Albidovulum sp.]|nr:RNA polymerase sigma factor RpoH [Albidovulum sp.]MDE0532829.1 RNA polymerase sigma factor RpoH [Albidovulum sp.]